MKIDKLKLTGWKGVTAAMDLGPLTLISGPNGSGKTARLSAITYAITGVSPCGKNPRDVAKLGGVGGCDVGFILDNGCSYHRGVRVAIGGTVSATVTPGVADHCGDFAPMFDIGAFVALGPKRSREVILDLASKAQSSTGLENELRKTMLDEAANAAELACINDVLEGGDSCDQVALVARTIKNCAKYKKSAKAEHARQSEVARGLAASKNALNVVAGTLEELDELLAKTREKRDGFLGELKLQAGRVTAQSSLEGQIHSMELSGRDLAGQKVALEAKELPPLADADAFEQAAADLDAVQREPDGLDAATADEEVAGKLAKEALHRINNDSRTKMMADNALGVLDAKIEAEKDSPWPRLRELVTEFAELMDVPDKGEELLVEIDGIINRQSAPGLMTDLLKERDEAKGVVEAAAAKVDEAASKSDAAGLNLAAAKDARTEALTANQLSVQAQLERAKQANDLRLDASLILRNRSERDAKIADLDAKIKDLIGQRVGIDNQLNQLQSDSLHVPVSDFEDAIAGCDVSIENTERCKVDFLGYRTLEKELSAAQASAASEKEKYDAAVLVAKALESARETMMGDLIRPLIGYIDEVLEHAAPGCKAYCELVNDLGTADFEIGWERDGRRIKLGGCLSGGETAIFETALAYALVRTADPPLKLLLLDADAVDGYNLGRICSALEHVSEHIDNILVTTHDDEEGDDELWTESGWQIIQLPARVAKAGVA